MKYNPLRIWQRRSEAMSPTARSFLASLRTVSVCFAISKIFSSIALIIMARILGKDTFGLAQVVLLISQVISPLMLFGLHMSAVQFGSGKPDPVPYIRTTFSFSILTTIIISLAVWFAGPLFEYWMDFNTPMRLWAIGLAVLISAYMLFTHYHQMMAQYTARGVIELVLGIILLPCLAVGFWIAGASYSAILITYAVAYTVCVAIMAWRFRDMLLRRTNTHTNWREMLEYGALACFSGIGFILVFAVQPLQLNYYTDTGQVGIFRLYSGSSLNMAIFATTIFYTVFFTKVSASANKQHIWRILTRSWMRAAVPLTLLYAAIFCAGVWLAGPQYPLTPFRVLLFSVASTLITVQTTLGQTVAAHGVRGIRTIMFIGLGNGLLNVVLSDLLISHFGLNGAGLALIVNFGLTIIVTSMIYTRLFRDAPPPPHLVGAAHE